MTRRFVFRDSGSRLDERRDYVVQSRERRQIAELTFSQAKSTGAVARPSLRSAAAGLPIVSDDDTKSNRSSTNWKARPRFLPYWKAVSTSGASAPEIVAACKEFYLIFTHQISHQNIFEVKT